MLSLIVCCFGIANLIFISFIIFPAFVLISIHVILIYLLVSYLLLKVIRFCYCLLREDLRFCLYIIGLVKIVFMLMEGWIFM